MPSSTVWVFITMFAPSQSMIWLAVIAWTARANVLMLDNRFFVSLCIVHSLCCLRRSCVRPVGYLAVCLSPRCTQYHSSCMVSGTSVHLILPAPSMAVPAPYFFLHTLLLLVHGGFQFASQKGMMLFSSSSLIKTMIPVGLLCSCVVAISPPFLCRQIAVATYIFQLLGWEFSDAVAMIFCSNSSTYKFTKLGCPWLCLLVEFLSKYIACCP